MCNGTGKTGQNDVELCGKYIPKGWRLPVKQDLEDLMLFSGNNATDCVGFLRQRNGFNCMDKDKKRFPGYDKDVKPGQCWIIASSSSKKNTQDALAICDGKCEIVDRWKWPNSYNAYFNTRYIMDVKDIDIGLENNMINLGEEVEFYCKTVGVVSCEWDLPDGTKYNGLKFKKVFTLPEGYYDIKLKAKFINDLEISQIKSIRIIGCDISQCPSVILEKGFVKGIKPIIDNGINYGRPLFIGK